MKTKTYKYILLSFLATVMGQIILPIVFSLNFDQNISSGFPNITGNINIINFEYGKNNFEGMLALTNMYKSINTISIGNTTLNCSGQIEGLYYNNQRGLRFWPLDINSLNKLRVIDNSYNALNISGGLYFDCFSKNKRDVYGGIEYSLYGKKYYIFGGINLNTGNNSYSSSFLSNLYFENGVLSGYLFDNYGGIGKISTGISNSLVYNVGFDLTNIYKANNNLYYTSKTGIKLNIISNKSITYIISGDVSDNIVSILDEDDLDPYIGLVSVVLTGVDGSKNLNFNLLDINGQNHSFVKNIVLDRTPPSQPLAQTPLSGSTIDSTFNLNWSMSIDNISSIKRYYYEIGTGNTIVISGYTTSSTVTINSNSINIGRYYWFVKAENNAGLYNSSTKQYFYHTKHMSAVPDVFSFAQIWDAQINRSHKSNTITVSGLSASQNAIASIDRGALFINGNFVGKSGFVVNGDLIQIEMMSSTRYSTSVSCVLLVGSRTSIFRITTKDKPENDFQYSSQYIRQTNSFKIRAKYLFDKWKKSYKSQDNRLIVVINLLLSKIDSNILEIRTLNQRTINETQKQKFAMQIEVLNYLKMLSLDVIQYKHYPDPNIVDKDIDKDGLYVAPNSKSYVIAYDYQRKSYYSPDFINIKYFPTIDAIKSHIDSNNPKPPKSKLSFIKTIVAPNKKIYNINHVTNYGYTSPNFVLPRYFDSINDIERYININNMR